MKHIFQSSHTTNIQRAIDTAIPFNRCIMLHGDITLEIRSPGYIQRTTEFTIRSGHITISYYISMRNYIAIRNDVATGNNIRITGNITGRSNLPISVKIGINSSLSIYCKGAAHLLISFNFTISIYCGISFDFRRSFNRLASLYCRRTVSCSITVKSRITGYSKGIGLCTACYIQTTFGDSSLIIQGGSSIDCLISLHRRRTINSRITFHFRRTIHSSIASKSRIAGYIQAAFGNGGFIIQGSNSVNCLISLYSRRSINSRITFHFRRTIHSSIASKSGITGYSKRISLCAACYVQAPFGDGGFIIQSGSTINCLISLYSR